MEIITLDEFKAIGLKTSCKEEQLGIEMPKLWEIFISRVHEIKNRTDNYVMDICLEVVENVYTQSICVKVENFNFVPEGMEAIIIPEQNYIRLRHEGSAENIWMSFGNMQKWAKENGSILDPRDFKIDASLEDDDLIHELYIKILT